MEGGEGVTVMQTNLNRASHDACVRPTQSCRKAFITARRMMPPSVTRMALLHPMT